MPVKKQVTVDRSRTRSGGRACNHQDEFLRWSRMGKPDPAVLAADVFTERGLHTPHQN